MENVMNILQKKHSLGAIAICFCLVGGLSFAADAKISADKAKEIALARTGGEVMRQDMKRGSDGNNVYVFAISGKDGIYTVDVDSQTGRVVRVYRNGNAVRNADSQTSNATANRNNGNNAYTGNNANNTNNANSGMMNNSRNQATMRNANAGGKMNGGRMNGGKMMRTNASSNTMNAGNSQTASSRQRTGYKNMDADYDQALAVAIQRSGGGILTESEVKTGWGDTTYEFEIFNDGRQFDIDIDANGNVSRLKQKDRDSSEWATYRPKLDAKRVEAIALGSTGGGTMSKYKLDRDDGKLIHEVTLVDADDQSREIKINDNDGRIIESKEASWWW